MKHLFTILTIFVITSGYSGAIEGPTISFEVPDGVSVKKLVHPPANMEAFVLKLDDQGTERDLTLDIPDLSRWKDSSFEKYHAFASRSQSWKPSGPEEVEFGEFHGYRYVGSKKGTDGTQIFDVDIYLTDGTKHFSVSFEGTREFEASAYKILETLKRTPQSLGSTN
ncbi:hypothetical protein [Pelagicoccus sp. SDUM812003]|uniref:hypothetical protein n=1 Tax=Pelagicoccus sp. SDUM812003 TaxID=3041267 RepID=UPI002810602B|nr:hypothetical protein [Pelagicoccus sp. SDUM812003]MDQ8205863.1 hypothetical protein [Pelagicoccus sp. SDUM812003]